MYDHIPVEEWDKHQLPPKWYLAGRKIVWNEAKLTIKKTRSWLSTSKYEVTLDEGEWPSDADLMTLCDGDVPPLVRYFGGSVTIDDDVAEVTVSTN